MPGSKPYAGRAFEEAGPSLREGGGVQGDSPLEETTPEEQTPQTPVGGRTRSKRKEGPAKVTHSRMFSGKYLVTCCRFEGGEVL